MACGVVWFLVMSYLSFTSRFPQGGSLDLDLDGSKGGQRIHYQLFHNSKVYIINVIVFEITSKYYVIHPIQCFHLRIVTCLSRVYRDRWILVSRDIRKYGKTLVSILSNISRQFVAKKACRPIKKTNNYIFIFGGF